MMFQILGRSQGQLLRLYSKSATSPLFLIHLLQFSGQDISTVISGVILFCQPILLIPSDSHS